MAKKTYRKFSKKGLSKKNKLRKSKRKSLRSKRKSRKHGGNAQEGSLGPKITKRYFTYGHLPCDTTNKFQYFLCELAKYYYYKMNGKKQKEDAHKQKLIDMEIPEGKLDGLYDEVTAEDTAYVIKQKLLICFDTIQKLNDFITYEYTETKEKIRQGWSLSPSPIKVSI